MNKARVDMRKQEGMWGGAGAGVGLAGPPRTRNGWNFPREMALRWVDRSLQSSGARPSELKSH